LGKWIGSIFASVDRYYAEMFQLVPLKDSTLASFRLLIVSPLMDSVREALLDAIRKDRQEGITQDVLVVVKNTNELLVEISKTNVRWYEEEFEQQLLAACRVYYREEKERLRSGELYKQKVLKLT